MSLLYATGFDYFPDSASLHEAGWITAGTVTFDETDTCSMYSRQSLSIDGNESAASPIVRIGGVVYFAFWFMHNYVISADQTIGVVINQNGADENRFRITSTGAIKIVNPLSSVLGTSADGVIVKDTWHYIEIKHAIKSSISANDCIIKVDGVEVINLPAGTDTNYFGLEMINCIELISNSSIGNDHFYDDFICYDTSGSSWNDFKGPRYISTLKPNGNGNSSDWTRLSGSNNYEMLDDDEYDDDTTYVYASTVNNKDLYTFTNLDASVANIDAVIANIIGKKSSGNNFRTVVPVTRIGSTDYDHAYPVTLETDYLSNQKVWVTSPATAAAWTPSEINDAEFGIKVKS